MAKTFNTDRRRMEHKLGGITYFTGMRFGNGRNYWAEAKVRERRNERAQNNVAARREIESH